MNIKLIPAGVSQERPAFGHHLGLMYLASAAREWTSIDPQIELLDMRTQMMTVPQVMEQLKQDPPDVVGITSKTCEADVAKALVRAIKAWRPEIIVATGGPHPSIEPYDMMESCPADAAVIGEGETTWVDLLKRVDAGESLAELPGALVRHEGELIMGPPRAFIEDVDSIPFPAWDLVDIDLFSRVDVPSYFLAKPPYMAVFTSRACPYKCIYCHMVFGKSFRPRSAESVLKEVQTLYHEYGIREIHFTDDIFNLNPKRVHAICDGLIDRGLDVAISFPNGLKGDILDEETIVKMRRAGGYNLNFGVESGSDRIQALMDKHQNLEKIKETVRICDREGFITGGYFMMGFPSETREELEMTRRFILDNPFTRIEISQVSALPGSRLFDLVKKTYPGIAVEVDRGRFLSEISWFKEATGISIPQLFRKTYREFYLNPKRMWKLYRRAPKKKYLFKGVWQFIRLLFPSYLARMEAKEADFIGEPGEVHPT